MNVSRKKHLRIQSAEVVFCGVGEKNEKVGKVVFMPIERVCGMDE